MQPTSRMFSTGSESASGSEFSLGGLLFGRWKYNLFCALLGACAALPIGLKYGSKTWTYTAMLMHNRNMAASPHYVTPDVQTIATLAKSPDVLAELSREFQLNVPLKALDESLHAEVPLGSNAIAVSLEWGDPKLAQAMLDRMLTLFTARVDKLRIENAKRLVDDFQANSRRAAGEVEQLKLRFAEFQETNHVIDVERELGLVQEEVSELELALATARLEHENLKNQLGKLADVHEQTQPDGEGPTTGRDVRSAWAMDVQRRQFLRDRIRVAKDSEQVAKWKKELEEIERQIPTVLRSSVLAGPASLQRLEEIAAQLELELIASQGKIAHLETQVADKHVVQDRLSAIRQKSQDLQDAIENSAAEQQRVEGLLATLAHLQRSDAVELSVVRPATPALDPVRSNHKKLFLATFLAVTTVFTAPLMVWDLTRLREPAVDASLRRLGLPILARIPAVSVKQRAQRSGKASIETEGLRRLALRIQQFVDKPGFVVVFSSLTKQGIPSTLLDRLAECFAERGEQVLVMDLQGSGSARSMSTSSGATGPARSHTAARAAEGEHATGTATATATGTALATAEGGISDFLTARQPSLEGLVHASDVPGVEMISVGTQPVPREGLGTRRMSELLTQVRERYSLVLINGPGVAQPVDLELLSARADGIVFSAMNARALEPQAEEAVRELLEVEGPILGAFC